MTDTHVDIKEFSFIDVTKRFQAPDGGTITAVQSIDLDIEPASFVSIIGPSGCGKSTLLNMAAGLLKPTRGRVLAKGVELTGINMGAGYLTQHDTLLPWRTVEKNVGIALEIQGNLEKAERREKVQAVLSDVGLTGSENQFPSQLSGGMKRRAALARLLVYEPQTLLLDEPFGALDAQMRMTLQTQLLQLWERDRKTVLFVTHDLEEAILLGDKVVVFGANPGTIFHVEDIPFERPRMLRTLKTDPTFVATWDRLWGLLEGQIEN